MDERIFIAVWAGLTFMAIKENRLPSPLVHPFSAKENLTNKYRVKTPLK